MPLSNVVSDVLLVTWLSVPVLLKFGATANEWLTPTASLIWMSLGRLSVSSWQVETAQLWQMKVMKHSFWRSATKSILQQCWTMLQNKLRKGDDPRTPLFDLIGWRDEAVDKSAKQLPPSAHGEDWLLFSPLDLWLKVWMDSRELLNIMMSHNHV